MQETVYGRLTFEKVIGRGNEREHKIIATAELVRYGGNRDAHFSLTGEIRTKNGSVVMCSCIHEEIVKHFPRLEKFLRWHMFSPNTGPMHYLANALRYAGYSRNSIVDGEFYPSDLEKFNGRILRGAVPSDAGVRFENLFREADALEDTCKDALVAELTARLPPLMDAFYADMTDLFGAASVERAIADGKAARAAAEAVAA